MTTNTIACDRSDVEAKANLIGTALPNIAEDLDDATIADLSAVEISQMIGDELARVIRAARFLQMTCASEEHLEYYDRQTLERLVYLARRCCRNRMTASRSQQPVVAGEI
jgi:hypothetical protein